MYILGISQLKFSLKSEACSLLVHSSARQHFGEEAGLPGYALVLAYMLPKPVVDTSINTG